MSLRKIVVLLVLLAVGGSLLAACGRRNPPITPYEAAQEAREDARKAGEPIPPEPTPPASRPFILDPLID